MGNEDKIKDIVSKSKEIFLPDELQPEEVQQVYSLNDEFAKTRKNRSLAFFFTVAGFIFVIIASSIIITYWIQQQQTQLDLSISDFEDLRLRDLLETSNKYQGELNAAREDLDGIKLQMQKEILRVKEGTARQRETVLAQHLPEAETDKKLKQIQVQEKRRINAVEAQYKNKLNDKEEEILVLKAKVAASNKGMKDNVQQAENILNNYQKLHNIRMDKQKAYYENEIYKLKLYHKRYVEALILKYNPVFRSTRIQEILKSETNPDYTKTPNMKGFQNDLDREGALSKAGYDRIKRNIENNALILARMNRIPYENSVAPALTQMTQLTNRIIYDYENLWYDLVNIIRRKNEIIGNYRYAFDYHSQIYPEGGFVIDPRNANNIRIHLSTVLKVKTGDIGLIFRAEDEYIGKIKLIKSSSIVYGTTIEVAQNKKILPFDKILIKLQKETKE
ncbi:MAG TPA: hypothetical protein PK253_14485 [Spirochaetota bacterium]|nr:hypothetical protein [Spirochaetota bacterium]HPQ54453.1 hypothetical protein [Spirochaetota bacterium]